jgi:hypothetical protein
MPRERPSEFLKPLPSDPASLRQYRKNLLYCPLFSMSQRHHTSSKFLSNSQAAKDSNRLVALRLLLKSKHLFSEKICPIGTLTRMREERNSSKTLRPSRRQPRRLHLTSSQTTKDNSNKCLSRLCLHPAASISSMVLVI